MQKYLCALCDTDLSQKAPKDWCVGHDHQTGKIRAVICRNCNGIEGKIRNLANRAKRGSTVPAFVKRLLAYWDEHSRVTPSMLIHPSHKTEDEKRLDRNKKARLASARKKALKNLGK